MRRCLCLFTCLLFGSPLRAQDTAKPNALTPKEVADGWILLFDGDTSFGWKIEGDGAVADGVLTLGGRRETTATVTTEFGYGVTQFESLTDDAPDVRLTFNAYKKGQFPDVARPGERGWHRFYAQAAPRGLSLGAAGTKGFGVPGAVNQPTAITFHVPAGQKLRLRDSKHRPMEFDQQTYDLNRIFNAKDLAGWKVHPNKKSKFTVTPEGWLHIKDGPGDLQTEALYDDFILQLECKTNGKYLNSGVFFRCRPGEYQQGYEAQIHNGFDADKPKEYIVEEYDPKTNELKDKKKVKSPAIDYGTGAIYRRVPARKQAAKDGEWFTMTIIAYGRHIATWVNGIQMVDWTDNRPLKDNARNGCRLERGAISLQGHDPTTDLCFRDIRIAELPKK